MSRGEIRAARPRVTADSLSTRTRNVRERPARFPVDRTPGAGTPAGHGSDGGRRRFRARRIFHRSAPTCKRRARLRRGTRRADPVFRFFPPKTHGQRRRPERRGIAFSFRFSRVPVSGRRKNPVSVSSFSVFTLWRATSVINRFRRLTPKRDCAGPFAKNDSRPKITIGICDYYFTNAVITVDVVSRVF